MNILLDTHILLWHLSDNPRLSKEKSDMIENPENRKFFSMVSLWEIGIKKSIGKLQITQTITALVPEEIVLIDLKLRHIEKVIELPFFHRDPFDRMIIAQAITENLMVMSEDENFKYYNLNLI